MSELKISPWKSRTQSAERHYEKWEKAFQCETTEKYRRGKQWQDIACADEKPYVVNMVYSTIENKLSTYSFAEIRYVVAPKPSKADYSLEEASAAAQMKSDVVNTIVSNPKANFQLEVEAALVDSFFRFGVLEVGYSADWLTNPNGGKPLFASDQESTDPPQPGTEEDEVLKEPDQIPQNELVYVKRIHAKRFRVGGIEGRYLSQCNWCGYYDFYYVEDLKASKILQNTDQIESTHVSRESEAEYSTLPNEVRDLLKAGDMVKVWKIFDNRRKACILWVEENDLVIYEKPFKRLPLLDLRWSIDENGWYPIPPVFQWISPQDEINEARQMMRSYRRRFVDQYQYVEQTVTEEEIEKFEQAKDGALIKVKRDEAIRPISKPSLNAVIPETSMNGKDDFILVSGSSSDDFGVGDRITATQSMEISRRHAVRQTREQIIVARWLGKVGMEILMQAQEKFVLGLWVKSSTDSGEMFAGEMQVKAPIWQYLSAQDLSDGVDYDVDVLLTSMSPVANDDEKRKFMEFLAITAQFPQIAMSPTLIREAAIRVGYRNEKVIKEMQTMALMTTFGAMNGMIPAEQGGNQQAQKTTAQMTPNTMEQIRNQMGAQLGPTQ